MAVKPFHMPVPRGTRNHRTRILNAALCLFAENGVNGVAVPQIAAEAGVGVGTIYRQFESKEALVNALYRRVRRVYDRHLDRALRGVEDPRLRFELTWAAMIGFGRQRPNGLRFLALNDHRSLLSAHNRALERQSLRRTAARIRLYQRAGVFRRDLPPIMFIAIVWGGVVELFRHQREGKVFLTDDLLVRTRDSYWRLCTESADEYAA